MTGEGSAAPIEAELARTRRRQAEAADPAASVWVSAHAGTGKTHVLTTRVLRLLLARTPPERILCLTYTKTAAAEMSQRVFAELARWVIQPDGELAKTLSDLFGRAPGAEEKDLARTLFTAAIETPGGLKVQTIHAFAERLLQRFPLEAGVTPGFAILEEAEAHALKREAIDRVLGIAARERTGPLADALSTAIAYAVDERFDECLAEALRYRDWLAELRFLDEDGAQGLDAAELLLRRHFGVRSGVAPETLATEAARVLADAELERAKSVLLGGLKTDVGLGAMLGEAAALTPGRQRADVLTRFFFKSNGTPREKLLTNALKADHPDVDAMLARARDRFVTLRTEQKGAEAVQATVALMRLAEAVLQHYGEAKMRRAALDFDDLIDKTRALLVQKDATPWVLYKLDNGIDHILVDESQDTSPGQWDVVKALAGEFFSGRGGREASRTLFAVGDENQSIYSFQGAEPRKFGEAGQRFGAEAAGAGLLWRQIPLELSFRTVAPVLEAVDLVFADATRTPGVTPGRHVARRCGQAGLVEIWSPEQPEEVEGADAFSPYEEGTARPPAIRLAERIADTIQGWLESGELLVSENRPIEEGDILILVRKRKPFAAPMVAALKSRGIAVAGADRIRLSDQIAVQDLVSLGDFLTLPEDDLALAEVLKSPIFDLDDDDLLKIAHGRKGTLWKALLDAADAEPRYGSAAATLKRWRKTADFMPPYEFFARLLDADEVRARLLRRLGPDAAEAIDEFQNLALDYDEGAPPSLTGFLSWFRTGAREIRRDMEHGRNEVRVMTVHGAKGLEAPIVFLPDTCGRPSGGPQGGRPLRLSALSGPEPMPDPFVWAVKGTSGLAQIQAARDGEKEKERAEHNRLLYVAMTRARDRLYIAGFEGNSGRASDCWYDIVHRGLEGRLEPAVDGAGRNVWRLSSSQEAAHEPRKRQLAGAHARAVLPDWASRPARSESQLTVPLAPSRFAPYETDETGEPVAQETPRGPLAEAGLPEPTPSHTESRFLRGTLTHALLEHLPGLDRARWPEAAAAFVAKRGATLTPRARKSIVSETLAVLGDATFAPLFGPSSRAEVAIVAEIPRPKGAGPALRIAGQIDRLVDLGAEVLIVDYKTNRLAPKNMEGVAPIYLYQLAAYRLAVARIFTGKAVRAALLWTDGPRIMEIPGTILDLHASRLWDLDTARLDA